MQKETDILTTLRDNLEGLYIPPQAPKGTDTTEVKRTVFTGEITNAFMASNDDLGTIQKGDALSGSLTEYRTNPLNKVYFMKNDLFDNTLSQPTKRLFLFILSKLAQNVGQYETDINRIKEGIAQPFNIKEYMEECGLRDRKEAVKAIKRSIKEMLETYVGFDIEVYVKESNGKKKKKTLRKITNILSPAIDIEGLGRNPTTGDVLEHCIDRGLVYISFNLDFASVLVNFPLLDLPTQLFKLDIRHNPHALDLGYHLISLANQNRNKISVLNALEACPDIPLQQFLYEKPMDKENNTPLLAISKQGFLKDDVRPYKHLIEPLKRTLEALANNTNAIIKSYNLVDSKGKNIKFEDLNKNNFETSFIIYELTDRAKPRTDEALQKKITYRKRKNVN